MMRKGNQRGGFREVRSRAALGDSMRHNAKTLDLPTNFVANSGFKIDDLPFPQSHLAHVALVHENDHASSFNAAKPVFESVNGCVELVVASYRTEPQDAGALMRL